MTKAKTAVRHIDSLEGRGPAQDWLVIALLFLWLWRYGIVKQVVQLAPGMIGFVTGAFASAADLRVGCVAVKQVGQS